VRALDCTVCGEVVQADDDPALIRAMRAHVRELHGGEGEDAVQSRVESDAYAPSAGEPPWAY
jgi:hypothetical protein